MTSTHLSKVQNGCQIMQKTADFVTDKTENSP